MAYTNQAINTSQPLTKLLLHFQTIGVKMQFMRSFLAYQKLELYQFRPARQYRKFSLLFGWKQIKLSLIESIAERLNLNSISHIYFKQWSELLVMKANRSQMKLEGFAKHVQSPICKDRKLMYLITWHNFSNSP